MSLLKSKIKDISIMLIFIAMVIIGTKSDYIISDNLFLRNNWINIFVEIIAKIPVYFIALYACVGLFKVSSTYEGVKKYLFFAMFLVGGVICGTLLFEDIVSVFIQKSIIKYAISAILGLGLFAILYYFVTLDKEEHKKFIKEYLIVIISVATVVVLTFLLKKIVDRARFNDVRQLLKDFTPWYKKGAGGDSFPSGHMASFVLLFSCIPMLKKHKILLVKDYISYIILGICSLLVAFSRISHGMHFMTDVAMSGIIAFSVSKIVTWIILGIDEKDTIEDRIIERQQDD